MLGRGAEGGCIEVSEELMPCPFCGGEATIVPEMSGPLSPGRVLGYVIGCDGDGCPGNIGRSYLYPSEKVAAEAWNRRADRTCRAEVSHGSHGPEPRFPGDVWTMHHVCSACGLPIDRDDAYCKHCGARVVGKQ